MVRTWRYLVDFDTETVEEEVHDVVIIGSGVAGLYTALEIPEEYDIVILTKETMDISNSALAQGGIAVSLDREDSPELHFRDTIYAGDGLCDEKSVWVLVNEAVQNIDNLCKFGVSFDKSGNEGLQLSREAAHSMNRIVHSGDTTGKAVCDRLISVVRTRNNIKIRERAAAVDILTSDGVCRGVLVYHEDTGQLRLYRSPVVVCATGGFGQIYSNTTNPQVATGDGVCLAYRAGAELMDLEFVQFHPTVLYHPEDKSFLISEAVRGEGAVLKNIYGRRFMQDYHELCELAPRDVVSRAIFTEMQKTGAEHVYLDITFKSREYLINRFPNIFRTCLEYGIDISKDYIPVAPAEHYCMGGIKTDVFGRTSIAGFYACGEAACTGIHGANRLASNSLLEGLVFGYRIAKEVAGTVRKNGHLKEKPAARHSSSRRERDIDKEGLRKRIQQVMTSHVGIVRDKEGLVKAKNEVGKICELLYESKNQGIADFELQNMAMLSMLVIESALEREESRGAHYRADFPHTDDRQWKKHIVRKRRP